MKEKILVTKITQKVSSKGEDYQVLTGMNSKKMQTTIFNWKYLMDLSSAVTPCVYELDIDNDSSWPKVLSAPKALPGEDKSSFYPSPEVERKAVWMEFTEAIKKIEDGELAAIVRLFALELRDNSTHPLTADSCFSRQVGLLEATVLLVRAVTPYLEKGYNDDLLLAGAVLYYSGALKSVNEDYTATIYSALLGTGYLGNDLITRYVAEVNAGDSGIKCDPYSTKILALQHSIMSRSTCSLPATPEALILRKIDDLNCALDGMNQMLRDMELSEVAQARSIGNHYRKVVKL